MTYRSLFAGMAMTCLIASPAFAADDATFLTDAIMGSNAEIAMGQLATEKGESDGVKTFGATLVADHGLAKQEAGALAASMQVPVTNDVKPDAKEEMAKLEKLSGAEFDKEFAAHMVMDHEKDIAAFKEKAAEGDKPVPAFAAKTLPTLQKHLETAQSLNGG